MIKKVILLLLMVISLAGASTAHATTIPYTGGYATPTTVTVNVPYTYVLGTNVGDYGTFDGVYLYTGTLTVHSVSVGYNGTGTTINCSYVGGYDPHVVCQPTTRPLANSYFEVAVVVSADNWAHNVLIKVQPFTKYWYAGWHENWGSTITVYVQ
jgi:hypothetical protein